MSNQSLKCEKHGTYENWQGWMVCEHCRRLYNATRDPPEICSCGKRLLPVKGDDDAEFSARMVCSACAKQMINKEYDA